MSIWTPKSPSLAPYASDPATSRGRLYPEASSPTRSPHQRDRDRVLHSAAFRRLKYKPQVFVNSVGENYRTRLTHSLEVSQIARSVSRVLGLNEDLAEALALAHDLGHTCFGHAGEDALKDCMAAYDGFDHNAQSLRIVTKLERRYAEFDGLNLTWETLEGLVKHNGPLIRPGEATLQDLPAAILEYVDRHDLELSSFAGPEAQVAALSDDIAYNAHDLDDGLRAGLFPLEAVIEVPLVGPLLRHVLDRYPGIEPSRAIHETVRRVITAMVDDVCAESARRLERQNPGSAAEVRALDAPVIAFSEEMAQKDAGLKGFLFPTLYRHYRVNRMTSKARRVVREMFGLLVEEPMLLPDDWRARTTRPHSHKTARVVCDYIAGMTDRFALDEHARLFDPSVKP
ncbi:MAG TPA: deoxyguanosinetriphosphate triphosphohydrolase [Rhodospirillum rubrum]|nr:deoxyguanosinetriphosphate triphosphohydrolase [Rhodospirillum rubrum]